MTPDLVKVGPHGYVHGWIKVDDQGKPHLPCKNCGRAMKFNSPGSYWMHVHNDARACEREGGPVAEANPDHIRDLAQTHNSMDELLNTGFTMNDAEGIVREAGKLPPETAKGRGSAETLREYWTGEGHPGPSHGAYAKEIGWGTPGDFDRCVALVTEHAKMSPEHAKGYCNLMHHRALGYWPAQHARMERGKNEGGPAVGFADGYTVMRAGDLEKWNPLQARDYRGRWTAAGTSGSSLTFSKPGSFNHAREVAAYADTNQNLTPDQKRLLHHSVQAMISRDIPSALRDVEGAKWHDSAFNQGLNVGDLNAIADSYRKVPPQEIGNVPEPSPLSPAGQHPGQYFQLPGSIVGRGVEAESLKYNFNPAEPRSPGGTWTTGGGAQAQQQQGKKKPGQMKKKPPQPKPKGKPKPKEGPGKAHAEAQQKDKLLDQAREDAKQAKNIREQIRDLRKKLKALNAPSAASAGRTGSAAGASSGSAKPAQSGQASASASSTAGAASSSKKPSASSSASSQAAAAIRAQISQLTARANALDTSAQQLREQASQIKSVADPEVVKAGPHGYEHGRIKVGDTGGGFDPAGKKITFGRVPDVGEPVAGHPAHGSGAVSAVSPVGSQVRVRHSDGTEATYPYEMAKTASRETLHKMLAGLTGPRPVAAPQPPAAARPLTGRELLHAALAGTLPQAPPVETTSMGGSK